MIPQPLTTQTRRWNVFAGKLQTPLQGFAPSSAFLSIAEGSMAEPISLADFIAGKSDFTIIDVRKEPAFRRSGLLMPHAHRRLPFAAENWWPDHAGHQLVVFCVHGHEVSQAVAGFLADQGLAARYLEGGFEAYHAAGYPVEHPTEAK
jgi:thiosulfate sulfurtransferase